MNDLQAKLNMPNDELIILAKQRQKELEKVLKIKEAEIKKLPKGCIRISMNHNRPQYYYRKETTDRAGKYLRRKEDFVAAGVAQRDYDIQLIDEIKDELSQLDTFIRGYNPKKAIAVFEGLSEQRQKLVTSAFINDEQYAAEWRNREYERKPFEEDSPEIYTSSGIRMRSKSEILIAEALERSGIPYIYEYPVGVGLYATFHPDFLCLNKRTRKEYLWEHNGMMADPEYAEYAVKKINQYMSEGFMPGDNLILTFETLQHPLGMRIINDCIKKYLL